MLRIRNACFCKISNEKSFYKIEKKIIIKPLKVLELEP